MGISNIKSYCQICVYRWCRLEFGLPFVFEVALLTAVYDFPAVPRACWTSHVWASSMLISLLRMTLATFHVLIPGSLLWWEPESVLGVWREVLSFKEMGCWEAVVMSGPQTGILEIRQCSAWSMVVQRQKASPATWTNMEEFRVKSVDHRHICIRMTPSSRRKQS